jgi:hypothetical protein
MSAIRESYGTAHKFAGQLVRNIGDDNTELHSMIGAGESRKDRTAKLGCSIIILGGFELLLKMDKIKEFMKLVAQSWSS